MSEEKKQGSGGNDAPSEPTATPPSPPPPPKAEFDAPGFTWVTKGEKGAGFERVSEKSVDNDSSE